MYSEPFCDWQHASSTFLLHEGVHKIQAGKKFIGLHFDTQSTYTKLLSDSSGVTDPINLILNTNLKNKIAENREKLTPIVDTIKLCGHLGLSLRGHRDDTKFHAEIGEYSSGQVGNFIELLNFRVRAGDKVLEKHLQNSSKNAKYISKEIQNELITCCGEVIRERIISEVKINKLFSIIADEASDSSNQEQMSLVLRFVDEELNIREDFIGYIHCSEGLAGQNLASVILKTLSELNLNIQDCRGQGYDGAGAVAGRLNGCSAHILRLNNKSLYTHCFCHRLNLAICKCCSIHFIRNVFDQIKDISYFLNFSEPCQKILKRNVDDVCPESSRKKLHDVCRTRWIERVDGLDVFQDLFVAHCYYF